MQTYDRMQKAFPGSALPGERRRRGAERERTGGARAIARLERARARERRMHEPITVDVNSAGTVANITVPIDGNGTDAASNASLPLCATRSCPRPSARFRTPRPASRARRPQWKDSTTS